MKPLLSRVPLRPLTAVRGAAVAAALALAVTACGAGETAGEQEPGAGAGGTAEGSTSAASQEESAESETDAAGGCTTWQASDLFPLELCALGVGDHQDARYGPGDGDVLDVAITALEEVSCEGYDDIEYPQESLSPQSPTLSAQTVRWIRVEVSQQLGPEADAMLRAHPMQWATMFADGPVDAQLFATSEACARDHGAQVRDYDVQDLVAGDQASSTYVWGVPIAAENIFYVPAGSFALTTGDLEYRWDSDEPFSPTAVLVDLPAGGVEDNSVECGDDDPQAAVASGIAEAPMIEGDTPLPWDASTTDVSGFDPCAALSWATVGLEGSTGDGGEPRLILLFHYGTYVDVATERAYPGPFEFTRISDTEIQVDYLGILNPDSGEPMSVDVWWFRHKGGVRITGDEMTF